MNGQELLRTLKRIGLIEKGEVIEETNNVIHVSIRLIFPHHEKYMVQNDFGKYTKITGVFQFAVDGRTMKQGYRFYTYRMEKLIGTKAPSITGKEALMELIEDSKDTTPF